MTDEAARRRQARIWPLLAILVLVALLSAFLYLQWRKREAGPAVVKEPPLSPPVPRASAEVAGDKPPSPFEAPPPVERPEAFTAQVEAARKAIEEKRWADALAALQAARAVREDADILQPLLEAADRGLKEQERRAGYDKTFVALRDKVEELKLADAWDGLAALLDRFRQDHPEAREDENFLRLTREIGRLHEEAEQAYEKWMGEARKAYDEGRYPLALESSRKAARNYPERKPDIEKFESQVRERMLSHGMVRVPDAACWIGNDEVPDEAPLRQARMRAFLIDKYEVTNEEYFEFVQTTRREPPRHWHEGSVPKGRERHPVVWVRYEDAAAYAEWAGKRLPTAEEWEAAARGFDRRLFPWGNVFSERENVFHANTLEYWESSRTQSPGTNAVDAFDGANGASPWGVYGMGGNVWEWTSTDVRRKDGDREAVFRVVKGGSFATRERAVRCANILLENPDLAFWDVGFRCVRDIK